MRAFRTSITIHSSADHIWRILTDAVTWTQWNTTVEKIEGTIALGKTVKVYPKINPKQAFPVKVTEFTAGKGMVWSGGMPFGLFTGKRIFTLWPNGDQVLFTMEETFSGPLEPLIGKSIPNMQPVFEEFAAALKKRAEN